MDMDFLKQMTPPHFAKRPKPQLPLSAPTLVTAFTCGGLFEIGALYAGFRPILGVEFYPAKGKRDDLVKQRQSAAAADNYERNFGNHIIRKTIEDAVRDRDFCSYRPNAFHCSPSCTNLSQGNTQGSEDDGDVSAATAITHALEQLDFPEIFTLENVEAYQKSKSWQIIRDFLYANGYGVAADVVWASDYGNLETGEGVPQDRKRLVVRAVKGHFAPALPPKVPTRMGWYCAIADLIDELPDGELAPWQLQRLPQLVKDLLIDPNNPSRNYTTKEVTEPSFTITASHTRRPITTPSVYLVDGCNERIPCPPDQPSMTVCNWSKGVPSALLLNGQNASNAIVPHKEPQESSYSITAGAKWSNILLIERGGASDQRITTRTPEEPAWTIRSSIGTDQDGRNRNEVMNALVGCRVKKLNARAIARIQSVPDWYILPEQMKDAGPLIGNGVPSLLSEAIMRSLIPYVQQTTSTCFVDAVGSGPCFGPVVACAVLLKPGMEEHLKAHGITDSKYLIKSTTPQTKREAIWQSILPAVEHYALAYATVAEINSLGMGVANRLAMKRAVDKIQKRSALRSSASLSRVTSIIVDGDEVIAGYEEISTPVVKADQKYPGVSAASCLAKIFRDSLVTRLWGNLPYGLSQHKGYSTEQHKAALTQHGLHPQHHINNGFVKQYGTCKSVDFEQLSNELIGETPVSARFKTYLIGYLKEAYGVERSLLVPDIKCFVNAQANIYSYQGQSEINNICGAIQLAPGRTGKRNGQAVTVTKTPDCINVNLAQTELLYDSCAFTDVLTGDRVTPEAALQRQLDTLQGLPVVPPKVWLVSYDRLIDEKHVKGTRIKERWSVDDGELAVTQTVEAAKYLSSQRHRLEGYKLVMSCQGVDAAQYQRCVEQVLEYCQEGDVLGLGGWCILGKQKRWLPVFWEVCDRVIPIIARSGIKEVHIFGCTWYKPMKGFPVAPLVRLLEACDKHGLSLSVDGRSPIGNALWKTWKQAGATFPYWRHNLAWVKAQLATLRDSVQTHHINNEEYGIRQPNNAAIEECAASVSTPTTANTGVLTTAGGDGAGAGSGSVRGFIPVQGQTPLQNLSSADGDARGDSQRGPTLEVGQEAVTQVFKKETNFMVASLERTSTASILPEVLDILQKATIEGNTIKLNSPQLDRKLYVKVNDVLERIGGKWKGGKVSVHVFDSDPTQLLNSLLDGNLPKKNPLAFFATPAPLAQRIAAMVKESSINSGILEPSAGEGALALALRSIYPDARIDCIEIDFGRAEKLKAQGFNVVGQDFLDFKPNRQYSVILMNPPFRTEKDSQAYITHIEKAYSLLASGGELIAIAPSGVTFNNQKRVKDFCEFVQKSGSWEELDANAFASSGTGVSTVLIKLKRQDSGELPSAAVANKNFQSNFAPFSQSSVSFYANRDRVFPFEIIEVHPDLIELGLDTQCRSKESQEKISEWAEIMKAGEWDIDCIEPFHDYPELVADKNGRFIPLSHHRVQSAQQSQTTLKYKVWTQASLCAARIFAAASNPQKGQPWVSGDHAKRVTTLLDNWEQMDDEGRDNLIKVLEGVVEGQQMVRLRNSRKLSDYVIEKILGINNRTVSNHRKAWENAKKVRESGIKIGDRVSVIAPLNTFAAGEMGAVADIDFKKAEVWVSWDGQPGKAPFPIPLVHIQKTDEPKPAILHFNDLLDLLIAVDADNWDKDDLVAHQEIGIEFDGYRARYSSLKTGWWFVTPSDERLASLLESVRQTRQQIKELQLQSQFSSVDATEESGEVVTRSDEISGATPEQYAQAATVVPPLEPLPYTEGEVVMARFDKTFGVISGLECLGEVRKVEQLRCIIYFGLHGVEHPINAPNIIKLTDEQYQEVKDMHDRIDKLCQYQLDSVDRAVLEQLSRQTEYSDRAYALLENIEREYEGTGVRRIIEEFRS